MYQTIRCSYNQRVITSYLDIGLGTDWYISKIPDGIMVSTRTKKDYYFSFEKEVSVDFALQAKDIYYY